MCRWTSALHRPSCWCKNDSHRHHPNVIPKLVIRLLVTNSLLATLQRVVKASKHPLSTTIIVIRMLPTKAKTWRTNPNPSLFVQDLAEYGTFESLSLQILLVCLRAFRFDKSEHSAMRNTTSGIQIVLGCSRSQPPVLNRIWYPDRAWHVAPVSGRGGRFPHHTHGILWSNSSLHTRHDGAQPKISTVRRIVDGQGLTERSSPNRGTSVFVKWQLQSCAATTRINSLRKAKGFRLRIFHHGIESCHTLAVLAVGRKGPHAAFAWWQDDQWRKIYLDFVSVAGNT